MKGVSRNFIFLGTLLALFLLLLSLLGPYLTNKSYFETQLSMKNLPPSWNNWLGTDDLGRDIFTRICYGIRISLLIGISVGILDLVIGVLWGGIAAFAGGKWDDVMMRMADIVYSLPYLLVVILCTLPFGSGWLAIVVAIALFSWITMARIVRGQILTIKEQEYIQAAKSLGASRTRILFKHLIPNAMPAILVTLMFTIPYSIFTEIFLSFLGLGVQAPMASLGTMANEGLPALLYYPWRLFFPALFISLVILSFNLIGEGLKER